MNNPMEALENKAIDSRREMDILDALQSIKSRNARIDRTAVSGAADDPKVLDRVSSGLEVGDRDVERKLTEFEQRRKREQDEDEEEVRRVFGRAYLDGVPDIELGAAAGPGAGAADASDDGASTSSTGPSTPRGDNDDVEQHEAAARPTASTSTISVKRKLDKVEPTALSLLSDKSKAIVSSTSSMPPPPKKKKNSSAMAAKLGIKLKK